MPEGGRTILFRHTHNLSQHTLNTGIPGHRGGEESPHHCTLGGMEPLLIRRELAPFGSVFVMRGDAGVPNARLIQCWKHT